MRRVATDNIIYGVSQPVASMSWIIAGDLNTHEGNLLAWCPPFVQANLPCVSISGWRADHDAQRADLALPQGIDLRQVRSVAGWHSPPCASDVHDAVVVTGPLFLRQLRANSPVNQMRGDDAHLAAGKASTAEAALADCVSWICMVVTRFLR